ncbi:MAG: calcium-binding protein, partial [Thermodesulfobacteriota bacterium]|nr:calcium-binding protein [Thermodesulfobacteriota bacterium]
MIISKNVIREMLIKNELSGDVSKAYKLSNAKTSNSGYSFGQPQWDLANNSRIRDPLEDILKKASGADGYLIFDTNKDGSLDANETQVIIGIQDIVKIKNQNLTSEQKEYINSKKSLIDRALSSNYGKVKIDNEFDNDLDRKLSRLNDLLNELRANGKTQIADYIENNPFMQMALVDYDNQLYIQGIDGTGEADGLLLRYFKGEKVELGYGKEVQIRGEFGLEDYLNFYLNTKEGQDRPNVLVRRFSNILEDVGINNISLTLQDALFLNIDLRELLGARYYSIIFWNNDNVGMKNLILKAFGLYHNTFYQQYEDFWGRIMSQVVFMGFPQLQLMRLLVGTAAAATTAQVPRGDPLILDLDGDGTETMGVADGGYFDHDANGFAEQTGWAGSDDGLLVWDRNGDGVINNGRELFGDQTILKTGARAANGFQALAEWDNNLDGKIDVNDSVWINLKVWRDFDGDGYSSGDELYALNDLGIIALNTGYASVNITDPNGNIQTLAGTFKKTDETTGQMNNYALRRDTTYTIANEWLEVPAAIASLPDLQAYGNVYDLQQAMVRDGSGQLKTLVEQFIVATDISTRNTLMEQILFKWTGSDGISPTSRGPNIDARKLAVLERFFGVAFVGVGGANPNVNAAALLNQSYRGIFEMFYAGLMAQTHLKDLYGKITYTWDETTQSLKGDLASVKTALEGHYILDPISGETLAGEFIRSVKAFQAETMLGLDAFRSNYTFSLLIDSYGPASQINGTINNDTLTGTSASDGIRGGGGNDTISGGAGDDVLLGQSGDDVIDGGGGADVLVGGSGNDVLGGVNGSADHRYSNPNGNIYEGSSGNDILQGTLNGDVYKFNLGDGEDVVVESPYNEGWGSVYYPTGSDILRFGSGISPSDIQVFRSGNNLVFQHINGTDRMTVYNWYGNANGCYQLERI